MLASSLTIKKRSQLSALVGVLFCLTAIVESRSAAATGERVKLSINSGWKFHNEDLEGADQKSFDASAWQSVNIPHTWNTKDAFDDEPGYRRGASWYRRNLDVSQQFNAKRLFLYFEGVNHTAEVFVNGKKAGSHVGGYTAFAFDVTELVSFGQANSISVRVDNRLDKNKPPIDGDFTMYGGIYRDVWLIATDQVHFSVTDHASSGVRIETPTVSDAAATIKISGSITNGARNTQVQIKSTLFDHDNVVIKSVSAEAIADARNATHFQLPTLQINLPRLWSPDNPYLYRLQTSIFLNGKQVDSISEPLGFRWFRFDAKLGFFLNGKHLKLRGTNRHQDHAGYGNAVPDELQVRDLEIIKSNGFNFLRLAHYPQDPAVLNAADRLGLLIWEEIPVVNQIHVSAEFNENAKVMLREMIRQHRNHPSIIIWGYMNEVFLPVPKDDLTVKATVALARELEAICKAEDPTRLTAIAFDHGARELYHTSGLSNVTDVIGWNLYHGWYYETFEDLGKFMDEEHRRFPGRPLILSEYGVNGDRRLHSERPEHYDSTIGWQQLFHESYLEQMDLRPFIAASAIWNQFDFGSEFRGETIPHINQKGIYTYDRQPKDIASLYRANLSKEPIVYLALRDLPTTSDQRERKIRVYANVDSVELLQNGISLGEKKVVKNNTVIWDVSLSSGDNRFTAKAKKGNHEVIDTFTVKFVDYSDLSGDVIAVNVGSNAEVLVSGLSPWAADKPYEKNGWGFVGEDAKAVVTRSNIRETTDDPLYQTMLEGLSSYRFDVPPGTYTVELLFAEPYFKESNRRVFDVFLNGVKIGEALDLASNVGHLTAYSLKAQTTVKGTGIEILFVATIGKPILSGIRVRRIH